MTPCIACAFRPCPGNTKSAMLVGIAYQLEGLVVLCDTHRALVDQSRGMLRVAAESVGVSLDPRVYP